MLNQIGRLWQGQLFLERVDDVYEDLSILSVLSAIARKVDIHTAATQLTTQVSEREQIISAEQNMNRIRPVCDRLDHIELIQEPAPRCDLAKMLRLIDHHRGRFSKTQDLFDCLAVFAPW